MDTVNNNSRGYLGVMSLALINVSAIVSLRNLPLMATHGLSSIFFYSAAALFFFIPIALVCAELATGWPKQGGVYAWVSEAFGPNMGFIAIWLEWIESVVWLPTVLAFVAATAAYIINPALADNKYFLLGAMLTVLWGMSLINFLGMKTSGWVSTLGVSLGTIFPGALIIGLGFGWMFFHNPVAMDLSPAALIPDLHLDNIVFLTGVLLGFAGMEVAAFHAREAKDPQKSYPRAILLATIIILAISIFGSLAVAIVIPKEKISLIAGLMQAFDAFFSYFNMSQYVPFIALLSLIGVLALLNSWIIGPSKGLLASAQAGSMPKLFRRTNRHNSPVPILLLQAIIGSILASVFLLMPSVNSSYWLITVLTAQLILMMYLLIFVSAIKLRYSQPNTARAYKVPGGKFGIWLVAGTGAVGAVLSILVGFVPPHDMAITSTGTYVLLLLAGVALFTVVPLVVFKKTS